MKLLLDANLSRRLAARLRSLYAEIIHVSELGMGQDADEAIWRFAGPSGYVIISADADFRERALTFGPPPKVIWLSKWTHPTRDAERLLRDEAIRITEFRDSPNAALLVLEKR